MILDGGQSKQATGTTIPSPGDRAKDGDIFYNPYFGDYWIVKNEMYVLINDGWSVPLSDPVGFVKIGHIEIGGDAE